MKFFRGILAFFQADTGHSMVRLCVFLLIASVSAAICYLAFAKAIFNASEAVAVGSICTLLASVWTAREWKWRADEKASKDQTGGNS